MIYWKSAICFENAHFPSRCAWNITRIYWSHYIHLGKLFSTIKHLKYDRNKNARFFYQKMSKISHFLLKTCYFRIKNARFSKWYTIWSNRYKESIYHIGSFLKIYFELLKVKSKYSKLSFCSHYIFKKNAEKLHFCQIFDFFEKWARKVKFVHDFKLL